MDREHEYFKKELSRNKLDRVIYGLVQTVRRQVDLPDLPITTIFHKAYKASNYSYNGVKPKRLANYLSVRRLLLDTENQQVAEIVKKADEEMLGASDG